VLAGSVLVAREVEHRTAQFAWSIGTSRRRWFLDRAVPVTVVAVGAVLLAAAMAEFLEGSRAPWMNPLTSGQDFGLRGPIIVALAFGTLGLSVLVGAVIGRMLPALILAGVLAVAMRTAVGVFVPFGVPVVVLPDSIFSDIVGSGDPQNGGDVSTYPLITGGAWQAPDGRLLGFEEAQAEAPSGPGAEEPALWLSENGRFVSLGVPGPNIWQVELRQSLVLVAIGVVGLAASAVVVERRRPY
jgi:hypothetical protein